MMNWLQRLGQNRILDVGALVLVLIFIYKIALVLPKRSGRVDFAHYYVSSRFYLEGQNPYATAMQPSYEHYKFHVSHVLAKGSNPPLLLLIFAPLSLLPPKTAFSLWLLIQMASLTVILCLSWRLFGNRMSFRGFGFLCAGAIGSGAVYWHFFYSQVQLLLAAMTLTAFALLKSGRSVAACSTIMFTGLVKIYPLVLVPWFVWHGKKNMFGRLKLTILCLALAVLVVGVTGLDLWQEFFQRTPELIKEWVENRSTNFTVPSLVINIGSSLVGFAPSIAFSDWLRTVAIGCSLAILLMAYAICWHVRHNNNEKSREKEFGLLCSAMLAGSMIAWGHYIVFLIFPFAVAAINVAERPSVFRILGLVAVWLALNCLGTLENPFLNRHLVLKVLVNYIPLLGILGLGGFLVNGLRRCSLVK
jgi:hypothetical protein